MNNMNFSNRQREAIEQMKQMNAKSIYKKEPETKAEHKPQNPPEQQPNSFFGGINLPFLENFKTDGDLTLIIGILLLLLSEKADKRLLFALIYILL